MEKYRILTFVFVFLLAIELVNARGIKSPTTEIVVLSTEPVDDIVRERLGDKDIVVKFRTQSIGEITEYFASIFKRNYKEPVILSLFDDKELQSLKTSLYTTNALSKLIWGRISDELIGIKNIFFIPSGELYNIAIESMPHWADSCMMSDRFNLYRLSSARELAINRSETKSSGAVVYGGIQFDADVALMRTQGLHEEFIYAADSTNNRGKNWCFLSGTLVEAENIDSILRVSELNVTTISGNNATETTFKNLSGQKKKLIHIATHGFYWSESAAERMGQMYHLRFLQNVEDLKNKAMVRCGLLFAGAINAFNEVDIPAGVDDGVLTALEISRLDLRGCDLVVLSSSQSGLGEIIEDEIYGLQRGFKKAGAQTIMMSLWKVSDEATKDLMTQFYTALTSGKSKREAFNQAQQYVKEHDAEYGYCPSNLRNKRPHWASFILLDAIE